MRKAVIAAIAARAAIVVKADQKVLIQSLVRVSIELLT